ncbi:EAL domain-containing protein [Curvibacter sp. APW13]|uniref:putative bifunctional diguanylate cyclase/phosphodiesterase n=1 Tax=Curvibacter sp. APW13 TaxID=3077236 RepID=UPI0028DE4FD4|nr:EAL domain-containing protein [Curvibacter sp. APW13]MDT8991990.1 EAL domain-containing protein [Curvibacter sp. APW13]
MKARDLLNALVRNRPALLLASGRDVLEKRFVQINTITAWTLGLGAVANYLDGDPLTAAVVLAGLVVVGYFHRQRSSGRSDRAAVATVWVVFGVATFSMREFQGPFNDAMLAYPSILLVAIMLTSRRNAQLLLLAMIGAVATMIYLSVSGLHSFIMPPIGWNDLVYIGLMLLAFTAVSTLFANDMRAALTALRAEVARVRQSERNLDHLANHDLLTGLPNRRLFQDRLTHAIARYQRHGDYSVVLFMDLDHFKSVNDTQGHAAGDALLLEVARRLTALLRESDTASRFGGDEFVLLLEDLGNQESAALAKANIVASKLLLAMRKPIAVNGKDFVCTASLGAVLVGPETDNAANAIRHGDMAMYRAKDAGRNCVQFYDPTMQAAVDARTRMETELRNAVAARQIAIYLQPQFDLDAKVLGAEALARWQHPELGFIPPGEFIPLAEDLGLIPALGQQVLDAACSVLARWANDPASARWTLAVNVSVEQLRQSDFVEQVRATLQRHALAPQRLELEITESVFIDDHEETIEKMLALRAMGLRLALDDFGTGYSSLSYVRRLPIDKLKIDQSFLRDVQADAQDAAIVLTVIALAQNLGLDLIAEGVETQAQRDFLATHGCPAFQGYLYGKPMPLEEFQARYLVAGALA